MTPTQAATSRPAGARVRRAPRKSPSGASARRSPHGATPKSKRLDDESDPATTVPGGPLADEASVEETPPPPARAQSSGGLERRVGQVTELSDAWFASVRSRQSSALDKARKLVNLVDAVVPVQGGEASRRRKLVDGAFELADWAAGAQLELARSAMRGAVTVYVDVAVNVDADVDAFNGVETNVDVEVPTDVGFLKHRGAK